ncbi:MAG: DNA oxidative demethylase AlkB [Acidobacteria bacterium]|nr:DNA oxidative demethylase AlkB [Acidobacteriota bacterium]
MNLSLFDVPRETVALAEGAVVLRGFATGHDAALCEGVQGVLARSPWRHMITPGGFRMSVAMTNCGSLGWVSDERGYRYAAADPMTGEAWPAMPELFATLATEAAREAGYPYFAPDACLINRYEPGAKLTLHQDRNERDMDAPIVSFSLGLPAVFLFGGNKRSQPIRRIALVNGDVAVWGGESRLRYHGVMPLREGNHPLTGACRINLTFRKAG